MSTPETTRLNKYLALQLGISRREADLMIEKGGIEINGKVAELGSRILPNDIVTSKGAAVQSQTSYHYVILNKPVGYVCSRRRQGDTPTIYELLPENLHTLKTVGRLDKDSSGLIILTNDGDFAHQMTHPKFKKLKIYEVSLDKELEPLHQQMISDYGLMLEDGPSKLLLTRMSADNRSDWQVEMSEGRNRQIRRTFAALGYEVATLHRTHFGSYSLNGLAPGQTREFILDQKSATS